MTGSGPNRIVTRAALRYYGGKWRLADRIIGQLPRHRAYVEPFGGAMSVLLQKPPSAIEVYNDRDNEVTNFFEVLREQPEKLIPRIALTPFSRAEIDKACLPQTGRESAVERARRLYVRAWQSIHGAPAAGQMGWRYEVASFGGTRNIDVWNTAPDHLWPVVDRLRGVQIECDDWLNVVHRYDHPETLFYVDPPYPESTRGERWGKTAYKHELTDPQHAGLAMALHTIAGMVVLSGYDCPLYADLYGDWHKVTIPTTNQASKEATESLWISPAAQESQQQLRLDL